MCCLELRFDSLVIVGIGAGKVFAQYLGLGDFTDKHHVAAQIGLFLDLTGEHGVCMLGQIGKAVAASFEAYNIGELVGIPSGLHAEVADGLEGDILSQNADIELAGLLDDFPGQVAHLAGDCQPGGIGCHLHAGVDDASVVFLIRSGQHEQAIA